MELWQLTAKWLVHIPCNLGVWGSKPTMALVLADNCPWTYVSKKWSTLKLKGETAAWKKKKQVDVILVSFIDVVIVPIFGAKAKPPPICHLVPKAKSNGEVERGVTFILSSVCILPTPSKYNHIPWEFNHISPTCLQAVAACGWGLFRTVHYFISPEAGRGKRMYLKAYQCLNDERMISKAAGQNIFL